MSITMVSGAHTELKLKTQQRKLPNDVGSCIFGGEARAKEYLFENQHTAVSAVAVRTHQCDGDLVSRITESDVSGPKYSLYVGHFNAFGLYQYFHGLKFSRIGCSWIFAVKIFAVAQIFTDWLFLDFRG